MLVDEDALPFGNTNALPFGRNSLGLVVAERRWFQAMGGLAPQLHESNVLFQGGKQVHQALSAEFEFSTNVEYTIMMRFYISDFSFRASSMTTHIRF